MGQGLSGDQVLSRQDQGQRRHRHGNRYLAPVLGETAVVVGRSDTSSVNATDASPGAEARRRPSSRSADPSSSSSGICWPTLTPATPTLAATSTPVTSTPIPRSATTSDRLGIPDARAVGTARRKQDATRLALGGRLRMGLGTGSDASWDPCDHARPAGEVAYTHRQAEHHHPISRLMAAARAAVRTTRLIAPTLTRVPCRHATRNGLDEPRQPQAVRVLPCGVIAAIGLSSLAGPSLREPFHACTMEIA